MNCFFRGFEFVRNVSSPYFSHTTASKRNWRLLVAVFSVLVPLQTLKAGMVSVPPDIGPWQYSAASISGSFCVTLTGNLNNQPPETTGIYNYQECRSGGSAISGESCAVDETVEYFRIRAPHCPKPVTHMGEWVSRGGSIYNSCDGLSFSPILTMGIESRNLKPYELSYFQNGNGSCVGLNGAPGPIIQPMRVSRTRTVKCPGGTYPDLGTNQCIRQGIAVDPGKTGGPASCDSARGNPCDASSGNKFETETDYLGGGNFPLVFHRSYNSLGYDKQTNAASRVGSYWRAS